MRKKYLLLIASLFAVGACACACGEPNSSNNGVQPQPEPSPKYEVTDDMEIVLNQRAVTLCVGESFTLSAIVKGVKDLSSAPLDGEADITVGWIIDGDAAQDVVALSTNKNTATITALKVGETKIIAYFSVNKEVYFQSVDVTVKEDNGVAIVLGDNVGFNEDGYFVRLSTLETDAGDQTSVLPMASVYVGNALVTVPLTWRSEAETIARVDGNRFVAVAEGVTNMIGTCEVEGAQYEVAVAVQVYKPTVLLEETFTLETANLQTMDILSPIRGEVQGVYYLGARVGSFDKNTKRISLDEAKMPTQAAKMGDGRVMVIETSLAKYSFVVNMYTKILQTKDDLDSFAVLSKAACKDNAALWDGYFVLGNDIAYNGAYQSKIADINSLWAAVEGSWWNGGLYGFCGVFDGKGHNIEGLSIDNGSELGSFFGVLHIDGVIKNVSFTKASVAANSSFVCGAGGGTVENVYVEYASVGKGMQHYELDGSINTHCGTFFGFKEPIATANVSNCVVNIASATVAKNVSVQMIGCEYVSRKNVFLIGGAKDIREKANATAAYESASAFLADSAAQARYASFDSEFWHTEYGVPLSQSVFAAASGDDVAFTQTVDTLVAGTSYALQVNNQYVFITASTDKVSIVGNVVSVKKGAVGNVTLTATSMLNGATVSMNCQLVSRGQDVDLTKEKNTAYYDVTEGKVYFGDLSEKVSGDALYFINADGSVASFAEEGESRAVYAVTKAKVYKINCESVTKVIAKAEDLLYMRKDYTVSSYGNKGCYDGVTLGKFVLVNDIDCTGLELCDTGNYWENSRGFRGTFDGLGHTIANLSVGRNGLFGVMSYATVCNVNFTGVTYPGDEGVYVALFAARIFNSVVENVNVEFVRCIPSQWAHAASGLLCYETSFDSVFRNITLDISAIPETSYVAEYLYSADVPYLSKEKSTYENVTVIVADLDNIPAFAYNSTEIGYVAVEYPEGFTFQDKQGNVL